jgi:thiol-disulfide isomerase/thioredoxin
MQVRHFLPTLFLLVSLSALAASEKPAPAEDFSRYHTADELWTRLEELRKEPATKPATREEYLVAVKQWFVGQQRAADAFLKKYPTDARRHSAQITSLQCLLQLSRLDGATPANPAAVRGQLDAILAAGDAPDEVKGEASYIRASLLIEQLSADKPETIATFLRAADEFLAKYGTHRLAPDIRQAQFDVATQATTPEADAALKKLADGEDERVAMLAGRMFTKRRVMKEFSTKPLELKFKATDGTEVSMEKLRGKVVLVDFWASFCAPCIAEMPKLAVTYHLLRDKGFEIVGISLDQEKESMEAVLSKFRIEWPQYFDGLGFRNTISSAFGIESVPTSFLVDRKGMVRAMNLPGEELPRAVEKLLAE